MAPGRKPSPRPTTCPLPEGARAFLGGPLQASEQVEDSSMREYRVNLFPHKPFCCGRVLHKNDLAAPGLHPSCCTEETLYGTADFIQEAHDWICCARREPIALSRALSGMTLNPFARPFVFKPAEPIRGDAGASPTGPLSSDETLHATSAKLQSLELAERPVRSPQIDEDHIQSISGVNSKVLASELLDAEELEFDDVFYQDVAEEAPVFSHCSTEV